MHEIYNRDDLRDIENDGKHKELPRDRDFWKKGTFKTPGDDETQVRAKTTVHEP